MTDFAMSYGVATINRLLFILFTYMYMSFVCHSFQISTESQLHVIFDVTVFVIMWWLRSLGSLKSHVPFAEYSLFYRALLQKRHTILRSLLLVATPYEQNSAPPIHQNIHTHVINQMRMK